jgi:hypothetical protein
MSPGRQIGERRGGTRELDSNHRSLLFEAAFQRRRRERFVADSSLEGRRFELSVPPEKDWPYGTIVIDLCPSGPREEVAPDDDPGDRVAAGIARQDPAQGGERS